MRQHDFAVEMRKRCNGHEHDGPTIRLRQLCGDPVFRTAVHDLLTDRELTEERWAHDLREMWRSRLWSLVSTEHVQHYCDVHDVGIDRTMQYHDELRQLASQSDPDGDEGMEHDGPILGMHVLNCQCCVDCLLVVCFPTRGLRDTNAKRGPNFATAVLNKQFRMSPGNALFARMTECFSLRC